MPGSQTSASGSQAEDFELQDRATTTPSVQAAELAQESLVSRNRPKRNKKKSGETDADLARATYMHTSGIDYRRCQKIWRRYWQ
jgi:hypothetical protein